jgi:hypothetical protein
MGLLQSFKRIYKNDFPQQYQSLIDQLSNYINPNTEALYQTLTNNITLANNMYAQVVTLTTQVNTKGTPIQKLAFQSTLATGILGINVLNAVSNGASNIYPTSGIFCSFTQSGQTITINNIAGLPTGTSFTLTLVTFG